MRAGRWLAGAALVVLLAVAATAWPLATWAVSLALFGVPHVLVELRWVDERFARRFGGGTTLAIATGLALIVLVRVLGTAAPFPQSLGLELVLVAALGAMTLPLLLALSPLAAAAGTLFVGLVVAGVLRAPLDTLVVLAFVHNLTPVGFLAERLSGGERRRALLACAVVFLGVPVFLASGIPAGLVALAPDAVAPFGVALDDGVAAFVPKAIGGQRALDLFRAAAFLQCMHHATVLFVLPRLGAGTEGGRVPWPSRRRFALGVAAIGAVALIAFAIAFRDARIAYGVLAAVHAWVEVPVLLVALAGWRPTRRLAIPCPTTSNSCS